MDIGQNINSFLCFKTIKEVRAEPKQLLAYSKYIMYGYKDRRLITKVRLMTYLVPALVLLSGVLFLLLYPIKVDASVLVTVSVALIGWPLAVDNIFLQINNSLKRKLETDAIKQIDDALVNISGAFSSSITFSNDFVVQPMNSSDNLWYEAASKKHFYIAEEIAKMRVAFGDLYRALEGNEIVIIHLERYYRYLTIVIDDYIKHTEEINDKFLLVTGDWKLTKKKYENEVAKFKPLHSEWSDVAVYCMDFRKMIQNELLGDVFKRKLNPRQPLPGYGATLDKVATREEVQRLIDKRNGKIDLPKGLV